MQLTKRRKIMTNLFNQLERALHIQETKTHDTQLIWVGDDINFVTNLTGADKIPATLKEDTYLIMVGDQYVLFNRDELTEELVNEIKNELGI